MKAASFLRPVGVIGAGLVLLIAVSLNSRIQPLAWPDEALFSAPAAALADHGVFSTSVLVGLIPGMESATLWNSPLYMVLTALPYTFTGESQAVARLVSLFLAFAALGIFSAGTARFVSDPRLQFALPVLLAFDLTFQRAANTARMDMLTLCFFLGAVYCLMRDYQNASSGRNARPKQSSSAATSFVDRRAWVLPLCAGACTGAAALSHPIAVMLVPVALIWTLPRLRAFAWGVIGTALVFSLWLPYIFEHLEIFCIQFIAQLLRKKEILSFFGGDTGGVFKVFAAQYGGRGFLMILAGLMVATVAVIGLQRVAALRRELFSSFFVRLYATFGVVFALVLLSSEAWYPLYVGPFLLWTAGALWSRDRLLDRFALLVVGCALVTGTVVFTVREHLWTRTPEQVQRFETQALAAARDCRVIYLRVRPDPYFLYRAHYPQLEVLEFVPGKLQFDPGEAPLQCLRDCMSIPGGYPAYLLRRYRQIDCFLLDHHDDWEPLLRDYLRENAAQFTVEAFPDLPPLDSARLLRRRGLIAP